MKYQKDRWSCGAAAVVNALRALGKKVSEYKVRQYSNTTKSEGTDEVGIMNAITNLGFIHYEYKSDSFEDSFIWLKMNLMNGIPVILCTENWEHWVVAIGGLGDSIAVVDSSNFKKNKYENGTHIWDEEYLYYKWWNTRKLNEEEQRIYAISVEKE